MRRILYVLMIVGIVVVGTLLGVYGAATINLVTAFGWELTGKTWDLNPSTYMMWSLPYEARAALAHIVFS